MLILRRILDFIFPASCSYCRSPVGDSSVPYFCSDCWADFSLITGPVCPCCGNPYASLEALIHSPDHECGACRLRPPKYDQALSVGYFEGALREAIHQFKYRPCRSLGKPLSDWMARNVKVISGIDVIMPVPLHTKRLRQRGFNQALLLAHQMSEVNAIPLSYDNLVRIRPTRPQVELSGEERIRNVSGAFSVNHSGEIKDKRVLLVDDVFTTGATMNECASVLRRAGAEGVTALTLARAVQS